MTDDPYKYISYCIRSHRVYRAIKEVEELLDFLKASFTYKNSNKYMTFKLRCEDSFKQ